ncbi:uncharacterized protein PAC_05031 [Phialocephala subalpina]|uniref:Uncharacterized protein n=1 Tax=Phialocephala subalpina TaxID=576137 RepID=A0A1L7WQW0_9HELO|nr:uncharacterized protein PAC_05031 [Phialocephala subalpina]
MKAFKMTLPIIRNKPMYKELLQTLQSLEIKPRSWDASPDKDIIETPPADENTIQAFLLGLFKTDFWWFEDTEDEHLGLVTAQQQRDEIIDLASRRFAERCGRSARGESTRTFRLELTPNQDLGGIQETPDQHVPQVLEHLKTHLELHIREPPLTGDNLGLKTWGSAWTMAQLLPELGRYEPLQKLLGIVPSTKGHCRPPIQVLELGAGTGLVGLAAAAVWGVNIVLTDLPMIHDNLEYNVNANMPAISEMSNGHASAEVLDWKDWENALAGWPSKEFEIILAVDPLYDDDHPRLVADTIKHFSKAGRGHLVLTAVPLRDRTTESLCEELDSLMNNNGFEKKCNGENICRDDWESANAKEVMVRWALWLGHDGDVA